MSDEFEDYGRYLERIAKPQISRRDAGGYIVRFGLVTSNRICQFGLVNDEPNADEEDGPTYELHVAAPTLKKAMVLVRLWHKRHREARRQNRRRHTLAMKKLRAKLVLLRRKREAK